MMADARHGKFDVVLVWAFDRWPARFATSWKCWMN